MSPAAGARTGRVGLVVNPTAGKGRGAKVAARVTAGLARAGLEAIDLSGPDGESAAARARAGLVRGLDALVVVGGDGMVHLGVNVVAGTGVPLAIVAVGSGNDVARDLGLPVHDVDAAVALIAEALGDPPASIEGTPSEPTAGASQSPDAVTGGARAAGVPAAAAGMPAAGGAGAPAARATVRALDAVAVSRPGGPVARWYMAVLSCGIDAAVNDRANKMSWPAGAGRYVRALMVELAAFEPFGYRVTMDGEVWEGDGTLVAVANTRSFGGGLLIAPDARLDDGLLDVVIADGLTRTELLAVFPRLYRGTHVSHPAVRVRRARSVLIEPAARFGAAPPVAFADGERLDALPLQCDLHPGAVRVVARTLGA
ncbi:diacylglycerol/lipid kinase family protein [Georgenia thermotolerans]|uniref:Diacylglycerol kinase family lipid kinase n=1 Tax=Georgenia thermotolerans TaxID=527326 RepID=A0A7J5ULD8_9MICO|nr:diacylglycerol kinase family protein [Georgenia thermotolerans]KAE8762703.1 diacylglycerol kinase family lipid kinase [Georgenia thermotolerans]